MRIIGGRYRGRRLRTVEGLNVRPTSDRLRETLFNILSPRIEGSRFLDICAGSGAVGIEAISRGASQATFIDQSKSACSVIKANLSFPGNDTEARIVNRDAIAALKLLDREQRQFDIVFFDPPYSSETYRPVIEVLSQSGLLADEGLLIVEHRVKTPPDFESLGLWVCREVRQGESGLTFLVRRPDSE